MADGTLLSDLCSICNITRSKYRCPGCDARTCSLECYKRHQSRALCTGKRDPAKFIKKSQLVTPAGIDHDFNFITSVERGLERAEREVNGRGLGAAPEVRKEARRGEVSARDFSAAGVTVVRAPKGLSRQKENKTHRSGQRLKNIVWTVEWIRGDKTRLLTEATSTLPIADLQPFSKKRKRSAKGPSIVKTLEPQNVSTLPSGDFRTKAEDSESKLSTARRPSPATDPEAVAERVKRDSQVADAPRPSLSLDEPEPEPVSTEYDFFLLKPQTSSSRRVLIPISSSATLGECLRGRTVLEFPTIYVFTNSSLQLPDEFILEENYTKQEGQGKFEDLLKDVPPDLLRAFKGEEEDEKTSEEMELDGKKILDVLKQDLGGRL